MKKNIAEVIGTFTLVFMAFSTILFMKPEVGLIGISLSFGLAVVAMAYGVGPISGAHLNPAVSLGVFLAGRMSAGEMLGYWISQVIGGVLASLVLIAMTADPAGAATAIGPWGTTAALIFEVVATFIFVTVILGATQEGHATPVAGLAIGLTLTMIHLAGITVTGVSVNPARAIASNIFDAGAASQLWLYIIAPLIGGGLAGVLHKSGLTSA
ncbi:aquaporin [Ruegeria sp. HKCCD8929]|uniref:aquaporin n=1 Tax=Ruegeria sp. HKCCD8929 TaxID=2683006 RepID=UPI001488ABA7|nr:aquaporin [Ruegeria sp. HKCCD8929]